MGSIHTDRVVMFGNKTVVVVWYHFVAGMKLSLVQVTGDMVTCV